MKTWDVLGFYEHDVTWTYLDSVEAVTQDEALAEVFDLYPDVIAIRLFPWYFGSTWTRQPKEVPKPVYYMKSDPYWEPGQSS